MERDAEPGCIQRFEELARSAPARVAVVCVGETISYGELNARTDRLARWLRRRGVGSEVSVALCVERGFDLPIGLLAILKAGGVYVPLDPEQPDERLQWIARETASVVLAHRRHVGRFEGAIAIEDLAGDTGEEELEPPAPSDLACIVYTSGSTGPPKGVMIEHSALAARFPLSPYARLIAPGEVLAAVTAAAWMPSIYELCFGLAQGATVALATHEDVRDPARLARFFDAHAVTFVRAVPSLWQALVASGWAGKPDLAIVCHGEALTPKLAEALLEKGRGVWNTYGATEATSFSLVAIGANGRRVIPIGGGVRVCDEALEQAAIGEPGEIHVAGPVLARGYLNDQALTAARFLPVEGGRLYKTGDLARRLEDGTIEFLGRRDEQVKVRGHRVELGEVEAAVARHAPVKEVAVVLRERGGDRALVAYLVPEAGRGIDGRELRAALAGTLPAYMIPAAFVTLPALPRTANGKVDRAALPAPDRLGPTREGPRAEAVGEIEAAIADLFAEVLGFEVGADEDFFELGGHSLSAAQVTARFFARFGVEITLVTFFEHATVRRLASEITRTRNDERAPVHALVRVEERSGAPLSYAQERLWFLHALTPDEVAYNLPTALELVGPADRGALLRAIAHVVERHEALRTSFAEVDGRPQQTVHMLSPAVVYADISDRGDEARAAAERALDADAHRPFDLGQAPLVRFILLKVSPDAHVLYVCMHHVASDGWSKAVLRRELAAAYNAFVRGEPSPLPPLPFQPLDHAAWQRGLLGRELGRQLGYWKARLDGLETLELPADRPRPKVFSYRGRKIEARLPAELRGGLEALALERGASLYMVLLAAFQVLLARYSGQRDVAVGSPIAGRNLPATEGLIGFFVNTLVLRAEVDDAPFTELLARVKTTALEAYAHQDLPFERLVAELNPERDMGRHPLVQVVLALQNTPWEESTFDGLEARPFEIGHALTRMDLELHVWPRRGELECRLVYSTDLFDEWRMRRMLEHFERMLAAIVRAPETPIGELDLLSSDERRELLRTWNATSRPIPAVTIDALVAARAAETPDALALVGADGESLTYRALDAYANRLAHHLRALGVGREARVGVCLERSPELIVAQLALAKAGGAWLPLDPEYPDARLGDMLADSGARVLVTRSAFARRFAAPLSIIELDTHAAAIAAAPEAALAQVAGPDDLAYVIYTSGSTGRPNGVEVTHRGLVNLALWHVAEHQVSARDRATLLASPSFDANVLETWPYLIGGATLEVVPDELRRSPARLVAHLGARRISIAFLPTPLFEPCLDAGLATTSLRAVITGGDRLLRRPPPEARFTLFNHYGPTEITVAATCAQVPPDDGSALPPPIGRPIANTSCFVLDPAGRLVPIGVPGELYIGGAGVARGYTNRPRLTDERFVASPFADIQPERLYRTGDLVRWRPDGQLEFLGRVDRQVKLRGFRIEPAEIDAAIAEHPGVAAVITIARDDPPAEKRLVSYVVAARRHAAEAALALDYVARWRELYELEYRGASPDADPEFDITGWNSSFTGEPIPAIEMREWVDTTVAAIAALAPRRVLEIGCGTGLVLFPLARVADAYAASDFSAKAVAHVRRRVAVVPELRGRVTVIAKPAHDLAWLDSQVFDTVVLNSIAQYFPSIDYLAEVLAGVIAHVAPGGRVFVGDVRDYDKLEAFHRAVEAAESGDVDSPGARRRTAKRVREDKELTVAPAFFRALASQGRVTSVEVRKKLGRFPNEMNLFRYDVFLQVGDRYDPTAAVPADLALASDPLFLLRAAHHQPELRARLAARLPEHMMPAAFVFLDALPLTPNGKIDRRALPLPGGERSELLGAYVPPRGPTEQALAAIFQASLGVDAVSAGDNFFELGGHSLLAVQVVAKIQEALGVDLPLAALFEAPTIAGLARALDARRAPAAPATTPAEETLERLPLSPMDASFHYGRIFFGAAPHAWHQALEIELAPLIPLGVERLEAAILHAVNRHALARGRLSSLTALGTGVYWDVARRLERAPLTVQEVDDDARFDAEKEHLLASPFALDSAPAFRFALLRGPGRDVLLMRYNHGAVDASGLQCMLDSVLAHYLGRPDPARRIVPFSVDELFAAHARPRPRTTLARLRGNNELPIRSLRDLLPSKLRPAPIHADGGTPGARECDTIEASFSAAESRRLGQAAKASRSTLDRLFIVGLLRGAAAWNRARGETRRVEAYWAVNLRPPRYFGSVVANHFAWSRVRAPLHPETDDGWAGALLDPANDFLVRGALDWVTSVEGFHQLALPAALRGALMKAIRRLAPSLVVTNTLPFGELDQGELARAFGVRSVIVHSRYAFSDRPVIVIRERAGRLELRMIYPRALFDTRGAARFLAALKQGALGAVRLAGPAALD